MEKILFNGTDDTPSVVLDKDGNQFVFSGKSMPEDVNAFYGPIIKWIEEYSATPNQTTELDFKLSYFNTASSKILLDIMLKLEDIKNNGNQVVVKWQYPADDDDMLEAGKEYADLIDVPFDFISYQR